MIPLDFDNAFDGLNIEAMTEKMHLKIRKIKQVADNTEIGSVDSEKKRQETRIVPPTIRIRVIVYLH